MRLQISRLALVASAVLVLAACGTTGEITPAYPITTPAPAPEPETPPPPAPPVDNGITAAPTAPVTSQPLAPPAGATALPPAAMPEERPMPPPQTYNYPPPAPAAPPAAPVTIFSVTGNVVDAQGPPRVHTVRSGDTLDAIARSFSMTRTQLAQANDLEPPYLIKPGQRLTGPRSTAKAYVVGSGDTLFAISRRFNVTPAAIAEANNVTVEAPIRPGQRLILPAGFKDSGPLRRTAPAPTPVAPPAYVPPAAPAYVPPPPVAATPAPAAAAPPASSPRPPAPAPTPSPAARPAPATPSPSAPMIDSSATPSDQQIAAAGRGKFVWPVVGDILVTYGPLGTGRRSDGINIRTPAGAAIRAAAAGEVVYAGDQVPEFGNLVLIKHDDGWVTAYAHLQRADVKMRQMVTQGQQIGAAGMSGGVAEPQLHFEVRYAPTVRDRARPIDPQLVLPR